MKINVKKVGTDWDLPKFRELARQMREADPPLTYRAGYRAHYAVYQHENLRYKHSPGRRAKYLEEVVRTHKFVFIERIRQVLNQRVNVAIALKHGATVLLDASNTIIPLDTAYLRDSNFIDRE